jgi:hypothetical protein
MSNIEEQIHKTLHPAPKAGSLGREELDFYIAFAETVIEAARKEIEGIEPQGPNIGHKATALELMKRAVRQARYQVDNQFGVIMQSIVLTKDHGQRLLVSSNPRPTNMPEEVLSRRWQSYKDLSDAIPSKDLLTRLYQELETVAKLYGGDSLGTYILRNGEGLILRYLEAKAVPAASYYNMLLLTANATESDLQSACETMIMILGAEAALPNIQMRIYTQLNALEKLVTSKALAWEKPSGAIQVQSRNDGSINVNFPDMKSFQAWARTPH